MTGCQTSETDAFVEVDAKAEKQGDELWIDFARLLGKLMQCALKKGLVIDQQYAVVWPTS